MKKQTYPQALLAGLLLALATICSVPAFSQLLTTTPAFPVDTSSITIVVDCSKGNQGLYNYSTPSDVYVHTGVITNLSTSSSDWKYVKFSQNFNQPNPALLATSLGNNKYSITISNIRAYYGVPAGETILKIAILFRNGAGTTVERNSDGSDMYVSVYGTNLAAQFVNPPLDARYIPVAETITKNVGDNIPINFISNQSASLTLNFNGSPVATAAAASTVSASPVISVSGSQQIIGVATVGPNTVRDTINFFVAPPVTVLPLPAGVRDGINYESGDTSVVLVLRAPGKGRVSVLGDFNNWTEQTGYLMNKTPDGKFFWLRLTGLTPATEYAYQYYVDGSIRIGDPYTEKVLDPDNDQYIPASTYPALKAYPTGKTTGIVSVLQTREAAYNWQAAGYSRPDKRGLIIYELLVRDFVGNHDWNTLKDTLSYLKTLGINAIEVMPFNEFEGNSSWGYNPNYYFAPDKYYGPKNTLKAFIDECHKNGMAVIMDIALNHSFGSSPMVQLYYDAVNNRPAANNPWFNPVTKHAFNVGFDMNHESLDTKYYFDRIVQHWLVNYRLDGFRFDLAKGFTQTQTCDNNGNNCDANAFALYDSSRVRIWKRYYDSLQIYSPGSYVILEHFAANNEEIDLSNYGMMTWGNLNYAFNQATMGYVAGSNFDQAIFTARNWTQPNLVAYMESHDEERLEYKNLNYGNSSTANNYNIRDLATGLKRNEMAGAFCFMIPGPKMLWQFGELGYDYSINTCSDGTVNNNCRLDPKPIKWDYPAVTSRKRLHDIYAALFKLRFNPAYQTVFYSNKITQDLTGMFKWLVVTTDTASLVVVGNFDVSTASGTVTFPTAGTWYDYLTGATISTTGAAQSITLQYGEYHVYLSRNVTNVVSTPVFDISNPPSGLALALYPNPGTAASRVEVSLPAGGHLQLALYNELGQQQWSYDAGVRGKGIYQYSLNELGQGRTALHGGIYFLKASWGNQSVVSRLLLQP